MDVHKKTTATLQRAGWTALPSSRSGIRRHGHAFARNGTLRAVSHGDMRERWGTLYVRAIRHGRFTRASVLRKSGEKRHHGGLGEGHLAEQAATAPALEPTNLAMAG